MADIRITDMPAFVASLDAADLFEAVDVSDTGGAATGTNKKLTVGQLSGYLDSLYAPIGHVDSTTGHPLAASDSPGPEADGFMAGADKTKLDGVAPGANAYSHPNHLGDVTSVGDGAQTIATGAVSGAKIANAGVGPGKLAADAVAESNIAADAVTNAKIAAGAVGTTELASGAVVTDRIADDQVTNAKLANMAANVIKVGPAGGGDPVDSTIQALADIGGSLAATDVLLGQKDGGDIGHIPLSALDGRYLTELSEDTTPQLGGPLDTQGHNVYLLRDDGVTVVGALGASETELGAALVYADSLAAFDPQNGGVLVAPGRMDLYGTGVRAMGLAHSLSGGRQVYVAEDGTLFGVDPVYGWTASDTDAGDYDIGGGTTIDGPFVEVTGLNVVTGAEVAIGERLDVSAALYVEEIGGRSGSIDIAFTTDATPPTLSDGSAVVAPAFAGYVNIAFSTVAGSTLPASTPIRIWARANNGSHVAYDPNLVGTTSPHELVVSVPGGGGAPAGVVTWNGRSGAVLPQAGDYAVGQVTNAAALTGQTFTGDVDTASGAKMAQLGVNLLHPGSAAAKTATFAPVHDGSETPRYYINTASAFTVNVPSAGEGMSELLLGPLSDNITVAGGYTVLGAREAGKTQLCYMMNDTTNSQIIFSYGPAAP